MGGGGGGGKDGGRQLGEGGKDEGDVEGLEKGEGERMYEENGEGK